MTLREVFERHGCDKAAHGYHAVYEKLPPPARMLEVGVYEGASLRAWCEWWPKAEKVAIDTFERGPMPKDIPPRTIVRGFDSRTVTFANLGYRGFDLIIDDGSHRPRDQAATLRNLWPLLAPGGRYFIEDVWLLHEVATLRHPWVKKHPDDFTTAAWNELLAAIHETGQEPTMHDFRALSGKPDSVLLEVRKP